MTLEQAKVIVAAKDITTKEKRELFLQALKILVASAFTPQI